MGVGISVVRGKSSKRYRSCTVIRTALCASRHCLVSSLRVLTGSLSGPSRRVLHRLIESAHVSLR